MPNTKVAIKGLKLILGEKDAKISFSESDFPGSEMFRDDISFPEEVVPKVLKAAFIKASKAQKAPGVFGTITGGLNNLLKNPLELVFKGIKLPFKALGVVFDTIKVVAVDPYDAVAKVVKFTFDTLITLPAAVYKGVAQKEGFIDYKTGDWAKPRKLKDKDKVLILLHGFVSDADSWEGKNDFPKVLKGCYDHILIAQYRSLRGKLPFINKGVTIWGPHLCPSAQAAIMLWDKLHKIFDGGLDTLKGHTVDLVGHSQGGIVGRWFIQGLPNYFPKKYEGLIKDGLFDRLLSLDSPHDELKKPVLICKLLSLSSYGSAVCPFIDITADKLMAVDYLKTLNPPPVPCYAAFAKLGKFIEEPWGFITEETAFAFSPAKNEIAIDSDHFEIHKEFRTNGLKKFVYKIFAL